MGDTHKRPTLTHRGPTTEGRQAGPLGYCHSTEIKDEWSWGAWDVFKWRVLPSWLGGDKDILKKYKDAWVINHSATINDQARMHAISPILLAGVCWIEVGGDPDWIDSLAYPIRSFDHSADPLLEPLTITKKPELTSMGDVSIQLRRAAQAENLDFTKLNTKEKEEIIKCLSDEDVNIAFVARHLAQLREVDRVCFIADEEIRILGSRYNRGPELSLRQIKKNTSYGDFILKNKKHLQRLIKNGN